MSDACRVPSDVFGVKSWVGGLFYLENSGVPELMKTWRWGCHGCPIDKTIGRNNLWFPVSKALAKQWVSLRVSETFGMVCDETCPTWRGLCRVPSCDAPECDRLKILIPLALVTVQT